MQAQLVSYFAHGFGAPAGTETAGVGHHLDAALEAVAHDLFHLGHEGAGVAGGRIAQEVLGQDEHGELGEPVTGQHVDRTAVDHLARRRQPVAVEAAAVGDAERRGGHQVAPPGGADSFL